MRNLPTGELPRTVIDTVDNVLSHDPLGQDLLGEGLGTADDLTGGLPVVGGVL